MAADTAEPARGKMDEDDHDVLTFGEVGERLRIEIAAAAASIAELEVCGLGAEVDQARARHAALCAAAKRNVDQAINDENFEKFFGYPGKAKRALPDPPEGD